MDIDNLIIRVSTLTMIDDYVHADNVHGPGLVSQYPRHIARTFDVADPDTQVTQDHMSMGALNRFFRTFGECMRVGFKSVYSYKSLRQPKQTLTVKIFMLQFSLS